MHRLFHSWSERARLRLCAASGERPGEHSIGTPRGPRSLAANDWRSPMKPDCSCVPRDNSAFELLDECGPQEATHAAQSDKPSSRSCGVSPCRSEPVKQASKRQTTDEANEDATAEKDVDHW